MINLLRAEYPQYLTEYLGFEPQGKEYEVLAEYAVKRGCIQKGSLPDTERAAALMMDDFRAGKIGKITLETPE